MTPKFMSLISRFLTSYKDSTLCLGSSKHTIPLLKGKIFVEGYSQVAKSIDSRSEIRRCVMHIPLTCTVCKNDLRQRRGSLFLVLKKICKVFFFFLIVSVYENDCRPYMLVDYTAICSK